MLNGNAIAQVEPNSRGIHLFWIGPFSWVYSPGGWNIQRRTFSRRKSYCEAIAKPELDRIHIESEWRFSFGWLSFRTGQFDANTPAEIYRLDLDEPTSFIRVNIQAKLGFSYAMYQGKIVSVVTPKNSGTFSAEFMATSIDAVVSYLLGPQSIQYCIHRKEENEEESWKDIPFIIKGLQLPFSELDPSLNNEQDEFNKASSRLLPGEAIEQEEFKALSASLKLSLKTNAYPRHIDKILLLRAEESAGFEEMNATAPLLSLINHPKWRRALGLGWFDQDPQLQAGQLYEYRITGFFPLEDLHDRIYGFHTISSNTALSSSFMLNDLLLRFSQPPRVELAPGTGTGGLQQTSRRGIAIQLADQFYWPFPSIHDWSLVIDFPVPVQQCQLELMEGHFLEYEAWNYTSRVEGGTLMPGNIPTVSTGSPFVQLRLKGAGFLFTIRIKQALKGIQPVSMILPPVLFTNTPRPLAPSFFEVKNLQEEFSPVPESIPLSSKRPALGFLLQWQPALQNGLSFWPLNAIQPPPLESTTYQVEHKELPSADWLPILPEDNWIMGNLRSAEEKATIQQGADLMQLFPEIPPPPGNIQALMNWEDVFDFSIGDEPVPRPLPSPGTMHQYRIRAVDIIGRPSVDWKESNTIELRKLLPPPVPVSPQQPINDENDLSKPNGVYARLLVKDAPDLTPEELNLLGNDSNLIILHWGWHKEQRDMDPFTKEFRVYIQKAALDAIPGQLVSITTLSTGRFEASFQLDLPLRPDALKNRFLQLDGYPFHVESHEAGTSIKMILERRIPGANGQLNPPSPGPVILPVLIGSDKLQPQGWSQRIAVVPLTNESSYHFEIRNALDLSLAHTRDELWMGVSAADDQPYVEDKLFPAQNRKGNESPIVPVKIQGKFQGRPELDIPPPMEDVPSLVTGEPLSTGVQYNVDITGFLDPSLISSLTHIRLERTDAGTVFNQYRVTADNKIMAIGALSADPELEVVVPNPADKNNIINALKQMNAAGLANRYLVFLAAAHPYRSAFFEAVTPDPVPMGIITDTLPPKTNRFVYRIRQANAAGLISSGDAIVKMVLRVPSLKPGAVPVLLSSDEHAIQIMIPQDDSVTHLVIFYAGTNNERIGPSPVGSLMRIANRPDLYPDRLLRFRTPAGDFAKQFIKDLSDNDIIEDENGARIFSFETTALEEGSWQVWACSLTLDGIPSQPAGPWRTLVPVS